MRILDVAYPTGPADARQFFGAAPQNTMQTEPALQGDEGEQQLVDKIQAAIVEGGKSPRLRREVLETIRGIPGNDTKAMVRAWYDHVKDDRRFPYRRDPVSVQIIPSVDAILRELDAGEAIALDCKAKTTFICAGLETIGIETRVVTVDQHPISDRAQVNRHHVYPEWLKEDGSWEALDAVLPMVMDDPEPGDALPWSSRRTFPWETAE